jgi:hypothetical protein
MMNARGLMVILNIGLDWGLITPKLFFTAGILMAVFTTLVATPVFDAAYRAKVGAGLGDQDPGGNEGSMPRARPSVEQEREDSWVG